MLAVHNCKNVQNTAQNEAKKYAVYKKIKTQFFCAQMHQTA